VVPALLELLSDADAREDDSPGAGFAPLHAAALLGQLQAEEAIGPLLGVLRWCDPMDLLYGVVITALESFGPPVLEPALAAYRSAPRAEARTAIANVLSGLGVHDDRLLRLLVDLLHDHAELAAGLLGRYGDPAALPALGVALDRLELDLDGGPLENQAAIELAAAIEELEGTLSADQQRKLDQARLLRRGSNDLDEERADTEREDALRRFSESSHASGVRVRWAGLALEYAASFDGVDLAGLDADALRAVVFEHIPRKVSCEPSAAGEIIRSFRAFWTFAGEELHHPHAAACLELLGDDAIPRLARELDDPGNYGLAKSFFMAGLGPDVFSGEPPRHGGSAGRARKKKARKAKKLAQRRNRR